MEFSLDKKRMTVEVDRLSNLSDELIHKILSFISIKQAIQTSALSSRWRYIWTSMPYLNLASEDSPRLSELQLGKFSEFVTHVLSNRNDQIEVSSVTLTFRGEFNNATFERILNYAFSHNVEQLNITCLAGTKSDFPVSLFRSPSLKHLTLTGDYYRPSITTTPSWELPALATLNLDCVTLCDDNTDKSAGLFYNCENLKNLTLKKCRLRGLNGFNICHPGLSSLTLLEGCKGVNVVTPQLKNLTINNCRKIHVISAPNLSSLRYRDHHGYFHDYFFVDDDDYEDDCSYKDDPLQLSMEPLNLEKVDICIYRFFEYKKYTCKIVCLLQQLHSVKFLTLNLELVKLLASVELISHQPSPFVNLKNLMIYPSNVLGPKATMSTEVKNYLLDRSPGATLIVVSHEEVRAVMNVTSARNLMNELHVLLDEWKENSGTNKDHMKQDTTPIATHMAIVHEQGKVEDHRVHLDTKMKLHFGERVAHIKSYWEDTNEQFQKGYKNACRTTSLLQKIEEVLTKLPTSCQPKLQARFSSLCAEADTIMDSVTDRMMIQFDKKPSRSNVFFHEFATSYHPTS
ncbi:hypothetical protein SSX86_032363 [Deinandra increscens subsp. villosa]|uniref:F-box domain-containing protein n=1 Tax=Deinandra increscens subsp. villosa TaxID=3103831 RepID=A0AAP0C3C2_9ASTR